MRVRADLNFDIARCIGCGACEIVCPYGAVIVQAMKDYEKGRVGYDYARCLYCRRCANVCPQNAISYTGAEETGRGGTFEEKVPFEYQKCRECGKPFLPAPMIAKAEAARPENEAEVLALCPECRPRVMAERWTEIGKKR